MGFPRAGKEEDSSAALPFTLLPEPRSNVSRDLKLWNQEDPTMMDCNLELSAKAIPPSLNLLLLWYFIKTMRQVTKAVLLYMANMVLGCGLSRNLNTSLKSWF